MIKVITRSQILALVPHKNLSTKVWKNEKLLPEIRLKLLKIAQDFYAYLDVGAQLLDVTLTGSLANFNYTKVSDFDLHLIINYKDVDDNEALVEKLLSAKKSVWNQKHDITIKGHEVELYAQNETEPHHSTGVYSIVKDDWIVKPERIRGVTNLDSAKKKAKQIMREINVILKSPNRMPRIEKMKEKIKNMRQSGLQRSGEYSAENLAFKLLRRTDYIKMLYDAYDRDYDSYMSLDEIHQSEKLK